MKTIAIERGMDSIKSALEQRGYQVVYADEVNQGIYAFIYYEETNHLTYNALHASLENGFTSNIAASSGILLVNAKDKQINEIVSILENRLYSPLF